MSHLEELLKLCPLEGKHVIDVGSGYGKFAAAMAQHGASVTGVEIDESKVAHATQLYGDSATFRVGRGEQLPLEDNSADLVTFFFSMHHIPSELQLAALQEALRCLKSGGRLHVSEPHVEGAMTSVVSHVEDETVVRKQTQSFLDALQQSLPVSLVTKTRYDLDRLYPNFLAVIDSVVMVDEQRREKLPPVRDAMEETFNAVAKQEKGGYLLSQPCIMHHFEKT